MSWGGISKPEYRSIIPDDLRLFEEADIRRYFEYMQTTFHLSKKWEVEYKKQLNSVARGIPTVEFFFQFLKEHIEPALQTIIQRQDSIFAIARYLIKDRIKEKKQEAEAYRNSYHSGEWNKK
jgi:hypothetical protein